MAYWRWGDAKARRVVVCVHGLTRQGRDFDRLAQALVTRSAEPLQVICPDVVGRGRSEWLTDPMGYQIPQYAADMLALLGQIGASTGAGIEALDWVGTLQDEGASPGRLVLLIDPEQTPLAPLAERLLLRHAESSDALWSAARFEQLRLAEVLPQP